MEEQIIGILHAREAGAKMAELCRKYVMSEVTFVTRGGKVWRNGCFGREALEAA